MAGRLAEVVSPGVAVRIEVHHGDGPAMNLIERAQQRQRHRVVATQPDHVVLLQQCQRLRHQCFAHGAYARIRQQQVARIG